MFGSTAVVTGASRGIGRSTALTLARQGVNVLVHTGHDREAAQSVVAQIEACGATGNLVVADLSTPGGRSALLAQAWAWNASPDIWINNAGVDVLTGPLADAPFETKLQRLWEVDVVATIELSRAFAARSQAAVRSRPASIVNLGWDQAEWGMEGDSGQLFSAVKGAVTAFTRSAAKTYAPEVRVNVVAPGWIRTEWGATASEYWQRRARAESLSGRWGTPEDVASAVAWLCSDQSEFVNGQVICVNGGFRGTVASDG